MLHKELHGSIMVKVSDEEQGCFASNVTCIDVRMIDDDEWEKTQFSLARIYWPHAKEYRHHAKDDLNLLGAQWAVWALARDR